MVGRRTKSPITDSYEETFFKETFPGEGSAQETLSEDLREIMILQRNYAIAAELARERGKFGWFRKRLRRVAETVAGLLDRRNTLLVGVGASILLTGGLVFMAPRIAQLKQLAGAGAPNAMEKADSSKAASGSLTKTRVLNSRAGESFTLVIGSFRDGSNADQLVRSLQERLFNARSEEFGGLHVVVIGPINERGKADDVARSVEEAVGLAPQVLSSTPE